MALFETELSALRRRWHSLGQYPGCHCDVRSIAPFLLLWRSSFAQRSHPRQGNAHPLPTCQVSPLSSESPPPNVPVHTITCRTCLGSLFYLIPCAPLLMARFRYLTSGSLSWPTKHCSRSYSLRNSQNIQRYSARGQTHNTYSVYGTRARACPAQAAAHAGGGCRSGRPPPAVARSRTQAGSARREPSHRPSTRAATTRGPSSRWATRHGCPLPPARNARTAHTSTRRPSRRSSRQLGRSI